MSQDTDVLLAKYIAGEATETERTEVQNWLNASDANKDHFTALKMLWNNSVLSEPANVDEDAAWNRFVRRTETSKARPLTPPFSWQRAAAILALAIAGALGTYLLNHNSQPATQVASGQPQPAPSTATPVNVNIEHPAGQQSVAQVPASDSPLNKRIIKLTAKAIGFKKTVDHDDLGMKRSQMICNSTPCPIEICINQTMQCPDNKPAEISSCSILEPQQPASVAYKSHDKIAQNCSLTTEQITITSIATGEAIVLDARSTPSTAQDLFNYISGEKKGDILAGVFHNDCDNQNKERNLRFDNKSGNWVLE